MTAFEFKNFEQFPEGIGEASRYSRNFIELHEAWKKQITSLTNLDLDALQSTGEGANRFYDINKTIYHFKIGKKVLEIVQYCDLHRIPTGRRDVEILTEQRALKLQEEYKEMQKSCLRGISVI